MPIVREVVAGLVTSAAVELVEELAGPLVFLAFLSRTVPAAVLHTVLAQRQLVHSLLADCSGRVWLMRLTDPN
ncbi:MAG: hypothetical protein ACRDRI_04820 [Pseudonocardiaceae bacterium]